MHSANHRSKRNSFSNPLYLFAAVAGQAVLAGLLAGCGTGAVPDTSSAAGTVVPHSVQGVLHGGQNPIFHSAIQLYAAGKTGVGSGPRTMLAQPVYSLADGSFSLTGLYNCNAGDEVYLVATGGDSGSGINSAIGMMAALGPCSTLKANAATTFITVNEAVTVASVYALSAYMNGALALGADYTNTASADGLMAAFANTNTMVNLATGAVPLTSTGNGIVPQTTINSLANSLAACVNSAPASTACTNLFMDTTTSSSTPTDTLQATLNIAHNPSMKTSDIFNLAVAGAPFQPTLGSAPASYAITVAHPSDVLLYHNNISRNGVQSYETTLTPANVNKTQFGKLATYTVDSYLFAQPLYLGGVGMPDGVVHNLVFAASSRGTVYMFDADGAGTVWTESLVPSGERYAQQSDYGNCGNPPESGIVGTPVIDRTAGTIYLVTKTVNTSTGAFYHRLHAISLLDGTERTGSPVVINPTFTGTGDGTSNGTIAFNGQRQNERSALLIAPNANGTNTVWIAYASHCDIGPYHGIVLGYDGASLTNTATFIDTPNGSDGGIWMSNGGLAADAAGYIYASTGNGSFDVDNSAGVATGGIDYGDAALKLAPPASGSPAGSLMTVSDYFVPTDQATLDAKDLDVGGSEAILFTDPSSGVAPNLMIANDKNGSVYLINTDQMSHYDTSSTNGNADIQDFKAGGVFIYNFAFFNNMLYTSVPLEAYAYTPGTLMLAGSFSTTPVANTGINYTAPVVSANGTANGVVWSEDGGGTLHAYTPTLSEIYNTTQAAGSRDATPTFVKFTSPVIANGKVYLSGQGSLSIYGLLP